MERAVSGGLQVCAVLAWLSWLVACNSAAPGAAPPESVPATPAVRAPLTASISPDSEHSFKQVAGRTPFTVAFRANVSGGAAPYTPAWDFDGDGKTDAVGEQPAPVVFAKVGVYTATLSIRDARNETVQATRRIVAFGDPALPAWKYGASAHLERRRAGYYPTLDDVARAVKMMREGGIQAVRVDFNWDMLNQSQGAWRYDLYDPWVRIVRDNGLEILGILDYVSWWASSAQASTDWRVRLYSEPSNNYDFARYAYEVVSHFKNDVRAWQIWNEPNTQGFWKPAPNPARYAGLLQEAYLAVKYADPDAVVLYAGLSGNGVEGNDDSGLVSDFMAKAYAAGARGYFDAMAIHPYLLPSGGIEPLRSKIAAARAVMDLNGDSAKPLWLTEIGVPTNVPWWSTAPVQSEADAAAWLRQVYTRLWDLTPTIFWYEFQDQDYGENPERSFGMVHFDFSPKPAYDALRELAMPRTH